MSDYSEARRIAGHLLRIQAVSFSPDAPFTWASGLRSPVYCDNRMTISYPDVRRDICGAFQKSIQARGETPEVIAGTATAGIPHAAWLADRLDLPMIYVRSKPKGHGIGSQIEGRLLKGQTVIVIEDLVSTGGSSRRVVEALRDAGARVSSVHAIFSYELAAADRTFMELDVPLQTITRFQDLFDAAREMGTLTAASAESILEWRANPQKWSDQHS